MLNRTYCMSLEITGDFTQAGELKLPANTIEATAQVLVPTGTVKSPAISANGVLSLKSATKVSDGQLIVGRITSLTEKFNVKVNAVTANLNVIHASPDAPGVDLLIDNVIVNKAALPFLDSTGYIKVVAGKRNIKVNASGSTSTVIESEITFTKDKFYSLFAINKLSSISAILVADSLGIPEDGNANIRFFHLSPDAPAVNVGIIVDGTFTPIFSNRSFEDQASAAAHQDFIPVEAGVYEVEVRDANTDATVLNIPGFKLDVGKIYTIYAKGLLAGVGDQALGAALIVHN